MDCCAEGAELAVMIFAAETDVGADRLLDTIRPTTRSAAQTTMVIHAQIGAEPAMRFTTLNIEPVSQHASFVRDFATIAAIYRQVRVARFDHFQ